MSRMNPNELTVLNDRKFEEFCAVLGVKQQCVLDPDRKVIEKAFRRNALKCHPDKGGDPVVFKKLNDAYLKLIGHIQKLEQKVEEVELNNSILIEISKTAVSKWQEKLKTRYGWFKSDNCKHLIFDGPYKQYMGRSKMTGNLTLVLYEDPEDGIPKIHVRSSRYMAWIAEMMLPSHLHVDKNKAIQFDQWRMASLADFGIYFFSDAPKTPMPDRKNGPITPAAAKKPSKREMRKREREANAAKEKENGSKEQSEGVGGTSAEPCKDENNNSNQTFNACDDQPKHSKTNGSHSKEDNVSKESKFQCDLCSEQFQTLMEKNLHKKICFPQSDFLSSGMEDIIDSEFRKNGEKKSPAFICEFCDQKFTNMVWHTKHLNSCIVKIEKEREKQETSYSKEEDENLSAENKERERLEAEKRQKEKLEAKKKHREKLEAQKRENERLEAEKKKKEVEDAEKLKKEADISEAEKKKKEADFLEAEKKRKEKERIEVETKRKEAEAKIKEAERLEAENKRKEADRLEAEKLEAKRLEAERLENEKRRKEAERLEAEKKRKEADRLEAEKKKIEAERLEEEKKKIEAERLEAEKKRKESERIEAEKKRKEADRLEAEKKKIEADMLEGEKKRIEAERLEAEKKRKESERLEAEKRRKEADRLEAEKKKIEADKLEAEKKKIEAERLEAEKKRKEAERLKSEQKKKEFERLEAEKRKIEAEKLEAEQKKKESERLEAERKKIEADILEAEKKRKEAENQKLEDEKRKEEDETKRKEAERPETEYRPQKVESQDKNPGSEGNQISNNAKVQELMQRKEQERVIRENLKREKEVKVKEKDELRVRIKFEAEQELKKNKSVEVQEKKNILINGKQDPSSFSQDATKDNQKLPVTRDTGARNSEFAFYEKNRRENEMSDSFANKVKSDVPDHGNGQDNTLDTAVKANTMSTSVHHNTSSSKLNPDTCRPGLGLQSPERDSVFIPHDNIHLRENNNENVARQFYVVNKSMSPPVSKSLAHSEVINKPAVISAVSTAVNADLVPSSSVSNKIFRDYASRQEAGNKEKDKTYLDRELETLDKRHAVKLDNITESYREAKKIDLDNKDVNVNRPVALGPSRFDSTSGYSRPAFTSQEPAPKRNSSSSQSKLATREPEPSTAASTVSSSKSGITKSFTTADLMSPGSRRRFDTNFNAMPEPFKPAIATETTSRFGESRFSQTNNTSSDFGSKRDASISNYGGQRNFSTYSTPQTASISSLQMPASYVCPPLVTTVSTVTAPSSSISSMSSRARSEGNGLIISPSSQYKDFYNQIQVTKDRYKSDVEKAMSFDRSAIKPPIIRERLPRPDNSHGTLGRERRVDREATVMKTMEGARRGKSDDLLRSSSYSRY